MMRINKFTGALRGRIAKKKSGSRRGSITGALRKRRGSITGAATTSGTAASRITKARRKTATTSRNRRTAAGRTSWVANRVSDARRRRKVNTKRRGR